MSRRRLWTFQCSSKSCCCWRSCKSKYGIAYIFISHDLAVIRAMAHRVMVMKDGRVVESGITSDVLMKPKETYTQRLLAAAVYADTGKNGKQAERAIHQVTGHRLLLDGDLVVRDLGGDQADLG
jgi:ABC-type dipeptide/oligopeptide/nickel transport system ATPase component